MGNSVLAREASGSTESLPPHRHSGLLLFVCREPDGTAPPGGPKWHSQGFLHRLLGRSAEENLFPYIQSDFKLKALCPR